jgi:hypothetical protein
MNPVLPSVIGKEDVLGGGALDGYIVKYSQTNSENQAPHRSVEHELNLCFIFLQTVKNKIAAVI